MSLRPLPALQSVLEASSAPPGDQDLLMALLHAALIEMGLTPETLDLSRMRKSASRFECRYALTQRDGLGVAVVSIAGADVDAPSASSSAAAPTATLRVSFLGSHVVAAACADAKPQAEVFRVTLKATDHVDAGAPSPRFLDPRGSLASFHDQLARPLYISMLADLGIEFEAHLLSLPLDLRTVILEKLDAPELAMLMCTCRELRVSCSDDATWAALVRRAFPAQASAPSTQADANRRGWFTVFGEKTRERREIEQRRRESAGRSLRVPPHLPPYPGGPPFFPRSPGIPGIIGGDYDLLPPSLIPMPGLGPGLGPLGGGLGGARGGLGGGMGPGFTMSPFEFGGRGNGGRPGFPSQQNQWL